jgi:hypothetical protein
LFTPHILITTNIIHDHPDIYPDASATRQAFADLVASIPVGGTWICNPSDPLTSRLSAYKVRPKAIKVIQYGSDHPSIPARSVSIWRPKQAGRPCRRLGCQEAGLTESQALADQATTGQAGEHARKAMERLLTPILCMILWSLNLQVRLSSPSSHSAFQTLAFYLVFSPIPIAVPKIARTNLPNLLRLPISPSSCLFSSQLGKRVSRIR